MANGLAVQVAEMTAMTGTSPPSIQHASVPLTKEAHKIVHERRRQAAAGYQGDVENAWQKIDQSIADIAVTHRKSIQCVQKELHMGRSVLHTRRTVNAWNAWCAKIASEESSCTEKSATGSDFFVDMIQCRKSEYLALTEEQKRQLVGDFTRIRNTKHTARRTSARSRINDITGTIKCIEDELGALRSRTGLESTLSAVRGSTDITLRPIHFETEGLVGFLGNGVRIDRQDLTSRMEGYSVQGIHGAAHNHRDRVVAVRSELRNVILSTFREITGDESAQMRYKDFWPKIVQCYRVQIEGWLSNITFSNLSDSSRSLPDLDSLLRKWKNGTIHWQKLTNEEYTRLENDRNEQIESSTITVHKRQTRSDVGTKRRSYGGHTQASKKARTTSDAVIASSDDESNTNTTNENASSTVVPLPSGIASPTPDLPSASTTVVPLPSSIVLPTPNLPSPPGVVSSPNSSSGTAVTPSSTTAATTPTGAGSIFDDLLNTDSNATGRFNNIFTGYNDPNYFFDFDFDFSDGTAPTMTF